MSPTLNPTKIGRKDAKSLTDSIHAITDTVKKIIQLEVNSLDGTSEDAAEGELAVTTTEDEEEVNITTETSFFDRTDVEHRAGEHNSFVTLQNIVIEK